MAFSLAFVFDSDGAYSDEDGLYTTAYGPFATDALTLSGGVVGGPYAMISRTACRVDAMPCSPIGSFFALHSLSEYSSWIPATARWRETLSPSTIPSAGTRWASGSRRSRVRAEGARAPYPTWNRILGEWDTYAQMPQANGVFYRPDGTTIPSSVRKRGRRLVGPRRAAGMVYVGENPQCFFSRSIATDWGIPPDCEKISFVFEVLSLR